MGYASFTHLYLTNDKTALVIGLSCHQFDLLVVDAQ